MFRRSWAAICLLCVPLCPAADSGRFRFAIFGDRTGGAIVGVFPQIVKEVRAANPDFAINVGDLIEGNHDDRAAAEWAALRPEFAPLTGIPFYHVAGNHDIWSDASRALFERHTGRPATYSFDHGQAHFTVLDNSGSFQLPGDQLAFLERDLQAHAAAKLKFVLFHQPSWLVPVALGNSEYALHKLALRYKVSAVISGHVHQYKRMELDGIVYVMAPSSGGHMHGSGNSQEGHWSDGWFLGWMEIVVDGLGWRLRVHEAGPPHGRSRLLEP